MGKQYVLGADCGTEGVRVGLFDITGRQIALIKRSYDTILNQRDWAEQDPESVLRALIDGVRNLVANNREVAENIIALGIDATAVTMVLCNKCGTPLQNAILWMDKRACVEAEQINQSNYPGLNFTGGSVSPEWALPKIMWLKRNQNEVYKNATYIVDLVDWLIFQLTGTWNASLCNLITQWNYVIDLGGWDQSFLRDLGIDDFVEKLPSSRKSMGSIVGALTEKLGSTMNLRAGLPVITAGMDSYAAAVGLGVTEENRMVFSLGTSSCYLMQCSEPLHARGLFGPMKGAIDQDKWVVQGGQTSAASIVKWYGDNFVTAQDLTEAKMANLSIYAWLDSKVNEVTPGSEGLIALDCWQGNRTPLRNPFLTGGLWGLTLHHTKLHIYRALLESVAYGGRMIMEAFNSAKIWPKEIFACGGGASSDLWLQIHADILGVPIVRAEVQQAAALGAAMCAAVGVGVYPNLSEATSAMVRKRTTFKPCLRNKQIYTQLFNLYSETHAAMGEIMYELSCLNIGHR